MESRTGNTPSPASFEVEGLRFAYPPIAPGASSPWVLDGIDLHVGEGEWLAVMGASDAGKTTFCLLLAGVAPHLTDGTMEGHIVVEGRDTREHPPPALAATVGLVFQEPEAQLFNATVEAEVAWGLENLGLPASEISRRVNEILALFHLDDARLRAPGGLSGGEKKRLALASVLAMRPALLILDEPMGGLDPVGRAEVLAALSTLRRDSSTTIVMAESDPEAVAAFADRLVVLHQGRIVLSGPPRALFGQVERLETLGVAVPQMARVAAGLNEQLGTAFNFLTVDEARATLSPPLGARPERSRREGPGEGEGESRLVAELGAGRRLTLMNADICENLRLSASREPLCLFSNDSSDAQRTVSPPPQPSPPAGEGVWALQVNDLWFWYDDQARPVLRGVDLRIPRGQFVALVGANGSGKTTLVKHCNSLLRPRRGQVRVGGLDVAHHSVGEMARQVGFLFQHPEQQIFSATVRQEVAFGPRNLGLSGAEIHACVEAALARFDLHHVAEQPPAILGYGLRRRVTLASLAAMDNPLLVLDEPTVGLDAAGLRETFHWLAELHALGRTILLVTHDMALAAEHAGRVVVLHQGQILADGSPSDVFGQPGVLARASLTPPPVVALARALRCHGLRGDSLRVEDFCAEYVALAGGRP